MAVVPQLQSVVINATDVERLVAFWSALLGVEEAMRFPGFVWLRPQHEGGISVAIQEVASPTEGRNRLHLDTTVDDLDAAHQRIVELGGSHLEDHERAGFTWRVMADPEGNEFCIARHEPS
jgi:predicted enzyme related to lactoylglutathione lyase